MDNYEREANYRRANAGDTLTPRQQKRLLLKRGDETRRAVAKSKGLLPQGWRKRK